MDEAKQETMKRIGARIREVRTQKHISQQDLAGQANLSVSQLSDIERGRSAMYVTTFVRIAEALQVSTDTILRTNNPQTNIIYQNEFSELLNDCTPAEIDSILKIVKEIKSTIRKPNTDD